MQKPLQHIGIIMDGNGRWAKKRFMPRVFGHIKGADTLKKIVAHCDHIGLKHLTVFAFGRENWQRPENEVSLLMKLMLKKLNKEINELNKKNAKIKFIGDRSRLSNKLLQAILSAEDITKHNSGLNFNICLDYSGQYDIVQAVNNIIREGKYKQIDESILESYLYTQGMPNPELIIRTSGEYRLSNFMIWQSAYSELYFTNIFWPDFKPNELDHAIAWYNNRERRFGQTSEQLKDKEHA